MDNSIVHELTLDDMDVYIVNETETTWMFL